MNQKKRIAYLDMAKGVGIVLMVAGHLIGSLQSIDNKPYFAPAYQWIASFHMPLFFIISGILLNITREEEKEMGQIVCRKARTLLLPYASFSLIYFVINVWTCIFYPELLKFSELWKFFIYSVTFRGVSVMWFLPALFLGEVCFLWCRKRLRDGALTAAISVLGFFLMFFSPLLRFEGWESGLVMMTFGSLLHTVMRGLFSAVFLLIGYYAARLITDGGKRDGAENTGRSYPEKTPWGGCFAEFLLGIVLLVSGGVLCFQNGSVDLNYMVFDNFILYMICACAGSFGVILLCRHMPSLRLLVFFGTNSLVIMATHMEFKVMMHAIQLSYWLNQFVTRAKEWVLFATMAVLITLMELGIVFVYNHYLYFLIGRKKPEKKRKREKEKTKEERV